MRFHFFRETRPDAYRSSRVRLHRVHLAAARWQCFSHFLLLFLSWIYRVLLRVRWAKTYVCRRRCSSPVGRPTCCPSCCLQIASLDGGDGARQVLKSRQGGSRVVEPLSRSSSGGGTTKNDGARLLLHAESHKDCAVFQLKMDGSLILLIGLRCSFCFMRQGKTTTWRRRPKSFRA